MVDFAKQVRQYTASRIHRWMTDGNANRVRAELASMRRGIGRAPGEIPELWGTLLDGFPEEMMSQTGEPTRAEWAVTIALTMFALHQQGKSISESPMHADGVPLGCAVRKLVKNEEDFERIRRRFNTFATAADMHECAYYLRGLVQLLRAEDIALDYPALACDLFYYQTDDGARRVRLRWGQDFYRTMVLIKRGVTEHE